MVSWVAAVGEVALLSSSFVASLAKGLDVLQVFNRERPELTLSEVAEIVHITPAASRRALLTLQELGFVTNHNGKYLLTPRVLRLSEAFLSSVSMQEVMQQYLQSASIATGDSSSVAVLDDCEIIYVASVPAKRSFLVTPTLGTRYPAYATSLGRAILAFSSVDTIERVLSRPMEKLTKRTITDPVEFRALLEKVRNDGYAISDEHQIDGVISVALPIFDADSKVVASVNLSTSPSHANLVTLTTDHLDSLREAQAQISAALIRHPVLLHSIQP